MVSSGEDFTTITHRSRPNKSIAKRERNSRSGLWFEQFGFATDELEIDLGFFLRLILS